MLFKVTGDPQRALAYVDIVLEMKTDKYFKIYLLTHLKEKKPLSF